MSLRLELRTGLSNVSTPPHLEQAVRTMPSKCGLRQRCWELTYVGTCASPEAPRQVALPFAGVLAHYASVMLDSSDLAGTEVLMTVCKCGMDCSEFIGQHGIPANATFNCPGCDGQLFVDTLLHVEGTPPKLIDVGRVDSVLVIQDARR